ncbi:ABC transporter permease [Cellulomonas sp. URHD0024]|uniref:ABC transporter permease n=1 Tax=Cellulomonas sp. URHD0024 TaxID=1302620 RepID=UPI00040D99A0|nr:ABC transporter permease [Cellulomonas sp. URHD0024]
MAATTIEGVTAEARVVTPVAPRRRKRSTISWLGPIVVFVLMIGLWYALAYYYAQRGLPYFVPYPHEVVEAIFSDGEFAILMTALLHSTQVAMTGLAIAIVLGVTWAVLMAQATWIERSLFPYAVVLQCIPILALVPLIGILFGYNFQARVIVTVLIALFPLVAMTLFGLQSVAKQQRELFQLQGVSRATMLMKLQFPAALPSIFVGLRTSAGLAVVGAVVGDQFFQRGNPGLGVLIQLYANRLQGPDLYAAIIVASLLGVTVFVVFGQLGRLVVGRWYDFS